MKQLLVALLVLAFGFPTLLIRVAIPRPAPVCARHDCGCHGAAPSESCCCNPALDPTRVKWGCTPTDAAETTARVREFCALPPVHVLPSFDVVRDVVVTALPPPAGPRFAPPVPPPRTRS